MTALPDGIPAGAAPIRSATEDVVRALRQLHAARRVLIVHADQEQATRDAVAAAGLGNLVSVQAGAHVDPGVAYLLGPDLTAPGR